VAGSHKTLNDFTVDVSMEANHCANLCVYTSCIL